MASFSKKVSRSKYQDLLKSFDLDILPNNPRSVYTVTCATFEKNGRLEQSKRTFQTLSPDYLNVLNCQLCVDTDGQCLYMVTYNFKDNERRIEPDEGDEIFKDIAKMIPSNTDIKLRTRILEPERRIAYYIIYSVTDCICKLNCLKA